MVKILSLILLISISIFYVSSENSSSFDLELYNAIYRSGKNIYFAGYGTAGMNFKSDRNRDVKGNIEIDFYPNDITIESGGSLALFELKKAFIKTRISQTKLTLGKTRTTWGEGFVFNSGDVIFGSLNPHLDLTQEEKRGETSWMTIITYPLGSYSFFETIFIPPQTEYTEDGFTSSYPGGKIEKSSAGGRLYTRIGNTKFETGYLYKGEKRTVSDPEGAYHRPYISLQGNIGPDWSISASTAIPAENNPDIDIIKKTCSLSFTLFHIQDRENASSLSFRLETLLLPYHLWEEKTGSLDLYESYGILLYPEIVYSVNPSFSISLQSILSPVDISASTTLGSFWNIYQNFDLINFITINSGDENDLFAYNGSNELNKNSFSIVSGGRYRF